VNWGLILVLYMIGIFYLTLILNIYLHERLEGVLKGKKVSFLKYFFCYDKFTGSVLPVTALPYPCFPSDYDNYEQKRICVWRNISSAVFVLHFALFIIMSSFYGSEITRFFNN
jgi:hypothetical protein